MIAEEDTVDITGVAEAPATISEPALGLSVIEIADQSGVSRSQVWRIMTGRTTNPSIRIAGKIATVLGLSRDEFIQLLDETNTGKIAYEGGRVLSVLDVVEVLRAKGKMNCREAEDQFGVSRETISRIWRSEN